LVIGKYEPRFLGREWVKEIMRFSGLSNGTHVKGLLPGVFAVWACLGVATSVNRLGAAEGDRFAHADSDARYLHFIELYDAANRKITAESDQPYSSVKTCGRCHDYEAMSHGWHFNAFQVDSVDGRQGEPWIWTDTRTGTQLPLSYRDWPQTYHPEPAGISAWQMARQFGDRIPGGGLGVAPETSSQKAMGGSREPAATEDSPAGTETANRWAFSGSLEIDCMVCHAVSGAYDFNVRREQIGKENFAWAATAALRLGTVEGEASRIKDGSDPHDETVQAKLPKVAYDPHRFAIDGTVFMDLVRKPSSNACYQCHSERTVSSEGIEPRWYHDDDVHLRAGMDCSDCHRNGIDHHTVRGFPGEKHPQDEFVTTLSCAGCHLGAGQGAGHGGTSQGSLAMGSSETVRGEHVVTLAGRLGSPKPMHAGLPPVHFEKMSCTACHSGPLPRDQALRLMTSLAHGLGQKLHRSGREWPAIQGPVYLPDDDGRVTPQRAMWPAFWGMVDQDEKIQPLAPEKVYEITRRALRVRNDFVDELLNAKLSSTEIKELLGEDRANLGADQWTEQESTQVADAQAAKGRLQFEEKVDGALAAIEQELAVESAVYVSAGTVYGRGTEGGTLQKLDIADTQATSMVTWPLAHQVRPAGWSLGIQGCTECHAEDAKMFTSTVAAIGPGPDQGDPIMMATLQGIDPDQRLAWNELFRGRATFKYVIGASLTILAASMLIGIGATIGYRTHGRRRSIRTTTRYKNS